MRRRADLSVWQAIFEDLSDRNFMIIAVAMDSGDGAAEPWIKEIKPSYVYLIDREHRLAELYNMVNVPQAVWIDEDGIIVRPTENAGAYEAFRSMDLATRHVPEKELAKAKQARGAYIAALRDWVVNGADSEFAFDANAARARVPAMTEHIALAHANFRLGQFLLHSGKVEEADALLQEATRLHPDSWNMWRQWSKKMDTGLASSPEFWQRALALDEGKYYPLPNMAGMPD